MCGIAGSWRTGGTGPEAIAAALSALAHRGPDDEGVWRKDAVTLGARRLSIIDLETGHQPIASEDGNLAVVQNGEIYNYRELRDDLVKRGRRFRTGSDTEVLLRLYMEYGEKMCAHLEGMFAFAVYDAPSKKLFLARDRFGQKPLYYAFLPGGGLAFASELKGLLPLLRDANVDLQIRPQGIYDYLSLSCIPQPETIYEGVKVLPPASQLVFDGERDSIAQYWSLSRETNTRISFVEACEGVRERIAEAVRLRLRSDVPLGVFLSGGIDSSIIAWEAAQQLGGNLQTFTVKTDDGQLDESAVAARTAAQLGVRNTVLPLSVSLRDELQNLVQQYDQPFGDSSAVPSLAISRLAREAVTVVLNGDGGDEIFAGYRRALAAHRASGLDWLPKGLCGVAATCLQALAGGRRSTFGFAARFLRGLSSRMPGGKYLAWNVDWPGEAEKRKAWRGGEVLPTELRIGERLPGSLRGLAWQLESDLRLNLPSDLLVKMDMASMAAGLEARSPLLSHGVAGFAASLPPEYLLRGNVTKALLREAYRGRLPDEVVDAPKRGFEIPVRKWLETDLREMVGDTVLAADARVKDYLAPAFVRGAVDGSILQHCNRPQFVWGLLVLELWLRERN